MSDPHTLLIKWPKVPHPWELEMLLSTLRCPGSRLPHLMWSKIISDTSQSCRTRKRGPLHPRPHLSRELHHFPDILGSLSFILSFIRFSLSTLCPRHWTPIKIFQKYSYLKNSAFFLRISALRFSELWWGIPVGSCTDGRHRSSQHALWRAVFRSLSLLWPFLNIKSII